jgi:hypothetical protein
VAHYDLARRQSRALETRSGDVMGQNVAVVLPLPVVLALVAVVLVALAMVAVALTLHWPAPVHAPSARSNDLRDIAPVTSGAIEAITD